MDGEATGTFEVTMTPAEADGPVDRMRFGKRFTGGLSGTSEGVMLSAGDPGAGAAGYVAIEQVTATLDGRTGGFALQHSGTMGPDGETLAIAVVPGSPSGALAGLSGTMTIRRADGRHDYRFAYRLP